MRYRTSYLSLGNTIALLTALLTTLLTTACQTTVKMPESISLTPENQLEIDRYLAAKIIQPSYGGSVFCSHHLLGAELNQQPQKLYVAMQCQEYYTKDGESLRTGTGTLGPVALTIEQSSTNLTIASHQITESKVKGPTLDDLFPAAILPAVKQANSVAAPELIQANEAKAKQYFVQEPVIKRLSGTWVGPSLSPLASPKTQELRTFTPQGTTYGILRNDWDFLAVPVLQPYQITIPPRIEQPKPLAIALGNPKDRQTQRGIFELTEQDQVLKLNLSIAPDSIPTHFTGKNSITFYRQNDRNIQIMANLETIGAAGIARAIELTLGNYIQTGRLDPTVAQDPLPFMNTMYRFQAQRLDDRHLQITAIAPSAANLPSFTAGVILADLSIGVPGGKKTPMLVGGICRSHQPSLTALAMPTLSENQDVVTCPAGSKRLAIAAQP